MLGKIVSHYKIVQKLGEGGMGVVYKAEDLKLERTVALKFLPLYGETRDEQSTRFIHEAKIASSLDHVNIGVIHEIGESDDGMMFIAMGFYDGKTLKQKIREAVLSEQECLTILLQVARGIAYAHRQGIIHRDLKPANVVITNDGIAKVIDFGLAKSADMSKVTRSGTQVGTAAYMSPEQARGEPTNTSSDIWALGVVLYEMLTQQLPFTAEHEQVVLHKIIHEEPQEIRTLRPDVSEPLVLLSKKLLQKEPEERFQTMEEVAQTLERLIRRSESENDTSLLDLLKQKRSGSKRKFNGFVIASIVLILLFGISFFAWKWNNSPVDSAKGISFVFLPLTNNSNPSFEYLADGISRECINQLSNNTTVSVTSPTTAFVYKNSDKSLKEIAQALEVNYIVKGIFTLDANTIQISLLLFDVKANEPVQISSKHIAVEKRNLASIGQEIVNEVAEQLHFPRTSNISAGVLTTPDVYETYLRGLYHFFRDTEADNALALEYFSNAKTSDSLFLHAQLSYADALVTDYENGWNILEKNLDEAMQQCNDVLEHDSTSSQAYFLLGRIQRLKGNPEASIGYWEKSVRFDAKNSPAILHLTGLYLFDKNEPAKAVVFLKQLQEIDPTNWMNNSNVGVGYAQMKDYDEAIRWFRRAIQLYPANDLSWINLGYALERTSRLDSALVCYLNAVTVNPRNLLSYENAISVFLVKNTFAQAESLATSGLNNLSNSHELFYLLGVTRLFEGAKQKEATSALQTGLTLVNEKIKQNSAIAGYHGYRALFLARLGQRNEAIESASNAYRISSSDNEIILTLARVYAILSDKQSMLIWFQRAHAMNSEYDVEFLRTALDFEKYRNDNDLLLAARHK
ncbi:MAG: protein kinase [Ignavibacteriae bacterium]|nr:protein kinase [Ignavibacteriota bacterium]